MTNYTRYHLAILRPLIAREDPPDITAALKGLKFEDLLKLNPEFQSSLESMVEGRLARDRRARDKEGKFTTEEQQELQRLREEKQERERKDLEKKGEYDRVVKSITEERDAERKGWSEKESNLLREIAHDRVWSQLVVEATKAGAVNPEKVAKLLQDQVRLNDQRKTEVLDDNGNPWLKGGKPVTIAMLIEKDKVDNPYLYAAQQTGEGSGGEGGHSQGDGGEGDGDKSSLDKEIEDAEAELKAAEEAAKKGGGGINQVSVARNARRKLEALQEKKKKAAAK